MSYLQINNLTIENKTTKEILLNNINLTIEPLADYQKQPTI